VCRIYLHFVLILHGVCVYILNSAEQSVIEHVISMATISKFYMKFKQISIERKLDVINNVLVTSGMLSNNVGSWSQTFWDSLLVPSSNVKQWLFLDFLTLEDRTDRLSWNKGNQLQTNVITYHKSEGLKCITAVAWNLVDFKYSSKENFWKIWSHKIKIECPNRS